MEIKSSVIADPRSVEEKSNDFTYKGMYGTTTPVIWTEKTTYKTFDQRFQTNSSSCVAQSAAHAGTISLGKILSAKPIYDMRSNYPGFGMWLQDAGDIVKKTGTDLEKIYPSQNMDDNQLNATRLDGSFPYKGLSYGFIPLTSIDEIAHMIDEHGSVLITLGSNGLEYTYQPIFNSLTPTFYHCVTAIDYTLVNGVKNLVVDDSANPLTAIDGQRLLTEDFLIKRGTGAMFIHWFDTPEELIKHTFTVNMVYGDRGDEVKWLQRCLVNQGFLKPQFVTGYFGDYTLEAVNKFQTFYASSILKIFGLSKPTGKVLVQTRKKLNDIYS